MRFDQAPDPQTLGGIAAWYENVLDSFNYHRAAILEKLRSGGNVEPRFVGLAGDDIDAYFLAQRTNLRLLTILNMVACAEAAIRIDYLNRVKSNYKDNLSKAYSAYHKTLSPAQKDRPPFDRQGILDCLKQSGEVALHLVENFRDVLRLRHWIAHGRYYSQRLANPVYSPEDAYQAITNLLMAMKL